MRFLSRSELLPYFQNKRVAIVGSGPGVTSNEPGFIDGHDVVVRVNNYKISDAAGHRTDVYYSFFGASIRKTTAELKRDGVTLCLCKCPDGAPIHTRWHVERNRRNGIDFRYIYRDRKKFWFCDTYIPDDAHFLEKFNLLGEHVPTTGFAAILDVLECEPASLYLTGFDFFRSGIHNVNEKWRAGPADDPIAHQPEREAAWLMENAGRFTADRLLTRILSGASVRLSIDEFKARVIAAAGPNALKRSLVNLGEGYAVLERLLGYGAYKRVLEIGTLRGVSAAWMAQFVDRVTTIDLKHGQLEKVFLKDGETFDRHTLWTALDLYNIDLKLVRSNNEKARIIAGLDFDFAFVDGDHTLAGVTTDFELVKKCGTVLFHDHDLNHPGPVVDFVKTLPRSQVEHMDIFALWRANG